MSNDTAGRFRVLSQLGAVPGNDEGPRVRSQSVPLSEGSGRGARRSLSAELTAPDRTDVQSAVIPLLPPSIAPAEGNAMSDEELTHLFGRAPLVDFHAWNTYRRPTRPRGCLGGEGRGLESRLHRRIMELKYGVSWKDVLKHRLDNDNDDDDDEEEELEEDDTRTSRVHAAA